MTTFLDIWTNADTSESGPTVDSAPVDVEVEERGTNNDTVVVHLASDGQYGLWSVALSLDPISAQSLALKMVEAAFSDRGDGRLLHLTSAQLDAVETLAAIARFPQES